MMFNRKRCLRLLVTHIIAIVFVFFSPSDCQPLSPQSVGGLVTGSPAVPNIQDRFKITANSIIRTHDSRALGAKYLNETELSSNQDCLQWCWNTNSCNLAVFEEKIKGSCYLFDCGPVNDFRCRFTPHSFYSSSLLQVNRNSYLLNEWKNQSNQEKELTNLLGKPYLQATKTQTSNSPSSTNSPKVSKCRHYQFECATNNECIAIYNVCDGIPQCTDGSDEAHELECHKSRLTPPNSESAVTSQPDIKNDNAVKATPSSSSGPGINSPVNNVNQVFESLRTQPDMPIRSDKHAGNSGPFLNLNYPHSSNGLPGNTFEDNWINSNRMNGAPAVVSNDYPNNYQPAWNGMPLTLEKQQQQQQQQQQQPSSSQSQGSSGLMFANEANQMLSESALKDSLYWPVLNRPMTDAGQGSPNGNVPFSRASYNAQINERQTELMNELRSNRFESLLKPRPIGNIKTELDIINKQGEAPIVKTAPSSTTVSPSDIGLSANGSTNPIKTDTDEKKKPIGKYANMLSHSPEQVNHSPVVIAVTQMHDTNAENGRETNSAVIALTLGLFITGILIFLVGCRMKSFKKRVARRGRSLAHDADYLINGMYL